LTSTQSWRIVILRSRRSHYGGIWDERRCGDGFRQDRLKRSGRRTGPDHPLAGAGVGIVVVAPPAGVVRVSEGMRMSEPGRMFVIWIPKVGMVERSPGECQ
jgi:hypothetical protein